MSDDPKHPKLPAGPPAPDKPPAATTGAPRPSAPAADVDRPDEAEAASADHVVVVLPIPAPISPERRAELERLLDEQFADGEDVEEVDHDTLYYPK